ncbi:MAG TPA: PadR family transcriptional regulator [Microbacteriaceae bacterium]|nr:PadR family transcriptional regulator [Microbacteriaceae bacterium]
MAVREALLVLLSVGPNYGFRLHTELTARLPQRAGLNVGQTYSTIERLVKSNLIERAGLTPDGLPLFALTETGERTATEWLSGNDGSGSAVDETAERVLLALSLGGLLPANVGSAEQVLAGEAERWRGRSEADAGESPHGALREFERLQAEAVLRWLDDLAARPSGVWVRPFDESSPRRGRPRKAVDSP